jgi:hypothetical protein
MCSSYHNIPTVNGVDQLPGRQFEARDPMFDPVSGRLTLDLTHAYPAEAALESFVRSGVIQDGMAVITDSLVSEKDGEVTFNLLCNSEPVLVSEGVLTVHGKTVRYDPALTVTVDSPDCSEPETESIPRAWDTERMYRILMTAPLQAHEPRSFILKVCR